MRFVDKIKYTASFLYEQSLRVKFFVLVAFKVCALTFDLRLGFSKTLCKLLLKEQSLQSLLVVVNSYEVEKQVRGGEKRGKNRKAGELHLSPAELKFNAR